MIAVDTNVLVHAHRVDASLHQPAFERIRELAESGHPWGICYHSLVEFYGVVTHPRIWRVASNPAQAMDQMAAWRESPGLCLLMESEESLDLLLDLTVRGKVQGALIHDARIAACCLTHPVSELWTIDRDFSRFPALKTRNPLN